MKLILKIMSKIIFFQEIFNRFCLIFILSTFWLPTAMIIFPLYSILKGLIRIEKTLELFIESQVKNLIDTYKKINEVKNEN